LRCDDVQQQPDQAAAQLMQFMGLDAPLDLQPWHRIADGQLGLPLALPAGHWRQYRGPLAVAFAKLEAVAARLGFQ
jgi:hypothetical protein